MVTRLTGRLLSRQTRPVVATVGVSDTAAQANGDRHRRHAPGESLGSPRFDGLFACASVRGVCGGLR